MTELLYKELTGKILRAYYTAYNGLSRTHPEFICATRVPDHVQRMGGRPATA